jgi:DNA-binding SARP family transcriptional activator
MLKVTLMVEFKIECNGVRIMLPSRPAQSLFAYLCLHAGKAVRREKLASLLWPDLDEADARAKLRHTLWRLRNTFTAHGISGSDLLPDSLFTVTLQPGPDFWLDVAEMKRPLQPNTGTSEAMAQLALYGELLPGFSSKWDEWVFDSQQQLEQVYLCKCALLMDRLMREGRTLEALDWGSQLLLVNPSADAEPVQHKMTRVFESLVTRWQTSWTTSARDVMDNLRL